MPRSLLGARFFFLLLKVVLWLPMHLRFRFAIEGKEHLPEDAGYILASNHLGSVDTLLLPMSTGQYVAMVAKIELFQVYGLGWLLRRIGAIAVRREGASPEENREFQRQVKMALNHRVPVCIFPEGTRSKNGELLGFNPGVGVLAVRYGCQVVPVGIAYSFWKVRIVFGEPIDSAAYSPKELTRELRRRIAELSGQELAADDGTRKRIF